ncbi:hypothetical protein L210DRAFT_440921, partial [Boletus edulis BED1]
KMGSLTSYTIGTKEASTHCHRSLAPCPPHRVFSTSPWVSRLSTLPLNRFYPQAKYEECISYVFRRADVKVFSPDKYTASASLLSPMPQLPFTSSFHQRNRLERTTSVGDISTRIEMATQKSGDLSPKTTIIIYLLCIGKTGELSGHIPFRFSHILARNWVQ